MLVVREFALRLSTMIVAALAALAPLAQAQTTPVQRKDVIEALASALEKNYVFPEVGAKYAAKLRSRIPSVDYAVADDLAFAGKVQADLDAINVDRHLRLLAPLPPAGAGGARIVRGPGPGPGMKAIEYAGRLTSEIAYIRFGVFPGDPQTMAELETFLAANAGVKILIVDARGHRGGGVDEIDAMFADLFASQVDLAQMETAKAVIEERPDMLMRGPTFRSVASRPGQVKVQHFVRPSAHPRMAKTKLYVLQSSFSGSAAEHLLLEVKMSGRGTLVGETSAGAGHFGFPVDLPNGFSTFIPAGRTFDPRTGWDWEGVGVAPDVAAPAGSALVTVLRGQGLGPLEAEALDKKVGFVMPARGPGGGPVIVVREAPPQ